MYVYKKVSPNRWEVGYYDPKGNWWEENKYKDVDTAVRRVHYLNGGDTNLNGYQTKILWHIKSVMDNYEADEETAMRVLEEAMNTGTVYNCIWEAIRYMAKYYKLEKK